MSLDDITGITGAGAREGGPGLAAPGTEPPARAVRRELPLG